MTFVERRVHPSVIYIVELKYIDNILKYRDVSHTYTGANIWGKVWDHKVGTIKEFTKEFPDWKQVEKYYI